MVSLVLGLNWKILTYGAFYRIITLEDTADRGGTEDDNEGELSIENIASTA